MSALKHATVYAGAMVAISFVSGSGLQLVRYAIDGAVMGVSAMANDMTHSVLDIEPSRLSSAAANGAYFALFQRLRGEDSSLLRNGLAGAATDIVVNSY